MIVFLKKHKLSIVLWIFILGYIFYFSYLTIMRYRTLYSSYYDLGIMNQVVFNTYKSISERDFSRFLEMTNTVSSDQVKRMAIHNDILLALLAPFYFISSGPSTLLVIQAAVAGIGGLFVYLIALHVFEKNKRRGMLALVMALLYLLYPPLQQANLFEFHAVTLATTFLLAMFYFSLKKRYHLMVFFAVLALLAKEQVAFTIFFFGLYLFITLRREKKHTTGLKFAAFLAATSIAWFLLSFLVIIPFFRKGEHFALGYYSDFGDSPIKVLIGIFTNPYSVARQIFSLRVLTYLKELFMPIGFLSFLSPLQLAIALPELSLNIISSTPNMINTYYHYTAVITPFVFISAIFGLNRFGRIKFVKKYPTIAGAAIAILAVYGIYMKGTLPYLKNQSIHPIRYPQQEVRETQFWAKTLKDDHLKISTTGHLAPYFTSRRYFYNFSKYYYLADYILLRPNEVYAYPEKNELIPVYEKLQKDSNYQIIYKGDNFEVYKRKPNPI